MKVRTMMQTQTITVDIAAPFGAVMSELANPMMHPTWATEFFKGDAEQADKSEVHVNVPRLGGACRMKVKSNNDFGAIDIYLAPVGKEFGKPLPVRVIENDDGATVLWTLSQFPGMPKEVFSAGCKSMQSELNSLKYKLEARS